jgi:multimeric flavodoxin WrbA
MNTDPKEGKMKVLLVNGSPHREESTFVALSEIATTLAKEGIETELFHIGTKAIHGCIACYKCGEPGAKGCVFNDDPANIVIEKMKSCDGLILGSPVHYAKPAGNLVALMDRVGFAGGACLAHKPAAAIVCARRGGSSAAIDALNKYFQICGMPTVPTKYWPMVYGFTGEEVKQDAEGMQVMRLLAKNMAWMLKSFDAAQKAGINPPELGEQEESTSFIR